VYGVDPVRFSVDFSKKNTSSELAMAPFVFYWTWSANAKERAEIAELAIKILIWRHCVRYEGGRGGSDNSIQVMIDKGNHLFFTHESKKVC